MQAPSPSHGREFTGKSGCGMIKATAPNGVRRPFGKWVCCTRPTGRRGGLSRTSWKMRKNRTPFPCCGTNSRETGGYKPPGAMSPDFGLYRLELNGEKVGDEVFTPGWTSYDNRIQYQTFDMESQLLQGKNAVGVILGDGWYRGNLAWGGNRNTYGDKTALLLQIEITYQDGRKEIIATDGTWKASTGPILASDIYNGEIYDARLEKTGWSKPGFSDADWSRVNVVKRSNDVLVAPQGPSVKKIEEIKPVKIFKTPAGETVVDMGQNMVGWVRLRVRGHAGKKITLRHAEVLDKDGNFYMENLRAAKQTTEYTLKH